MRSRWTFALTALMLGCTTVPRTETGAGGTMSAARDERLVGTWELVSTRATRNDSVVMEGGPPGLTAMKMLNATHYSVITRRDGQFMRAAGGRYTLAGNSYTEIIDIASTVYPPNTPVAFTIRLEGDLWTTDGGTARTRFHEVWRRVRQ